MDKFLQILNNQSIFVGILVSLIGGFVASFSPCALYSLPIIIGYSSKNNNNTNGNKSGLKYSLIFAIGSMVTFIALGIISVLFGKRIMVYGKVVNIILAIILLVVSLYMFDIIKTKDVCKIPKKGRNIFEAFFLGIIGGLIDSPCSAPILIAILTYTASVGNLFEGMIFMLFYSIGHSVIIILSGTSITLVKKLAQSEKYSKIGKILKIILGILILLLALYFIYISI